MKIKFEPIPKEKQLEAISKPYLSETREVLEPFVKIRKWPEVYTWDKSKFKKFFDFKREELVEYLKDRIKLCNQHYRNSIDNRGPGAFMTEREGKFKTGRIPKDGKVEYYNEFSNIYEATADYILIEYGMREL